MTGGVDGDADDDLAALRDQTERGSRADDAAGTTDGDVLAESIETYLGEIDDGERQKTLSVWDGRMVALFAALDEDANQDRLNALAATLRDRLDVGDGDADGDADRSEVLRLVVRLGVREADPELLEATRDAAARHAAESARDSL